MLINQVDILGEDPEMAYETDEPDSNPLHLPLGNPGVHPPSPFRGYVRGTQGNLPACPRCAPGMPLDGTWTDSGRPLDCPPWTAPPGLP